MTDKTLSLAEVLAEFDRHSHNEIDGLIRAKEFGEWAAAIRESLPAVTWEMVEGLPRYAPTLMGKNEISMQQWTQNDNWISRHSLHALFHPTPESKP